MTITRRAMLATLGGAATALVAGESLGEGVGRTKKEAEQQAAAHAWKVLTERASAS